MALQCSLSDPRSLNMTYNASNFSWETLTKSRLNYIKCTHLTAVLLICFINQTYIIPIFCLIFTTAYTQIFKNDIEITIYTYNSHDHMVSHGSLLNIIWDPMYAYLQP